LRATRLADIALTTGDSPRPTLTDASRSTETLRTAKITSPTLE
jgi:hypothetical protein